MAKQSGGAEFEQHIVATRCRIVGAGNFQQTLESVQAVRTLNLLPLALQAATENEPVRLANFQSYRIRLVGKVTQIDENFNVNRIIIYAKAVAIERPNVA